MLDADVAVIYGVETKRVNEAVKNNPDKFPGGYIMELDKNEWNSLKSKFSTSKKGEKVKLPSAFTEKGLYMLATILKSPQATISIVETFSKIRELSRSIKELSTVQDKADQKSPMQKSGVKKRERLHYALGIYTAHICIMNKSYKYVRQCFLNIGFDASILCIRSI